MDLPNADFYSAVAQALPLVFLAVAVEFRMLVFTEGQVTRWAEKKSFNSGLASMMLLGTFFLLTIALGEWAALRALHDERTYPTTDPLVIGALLASAVVLLVTPVLAAVQTAADELDEDALDQRWWAVAGIALIAFIVAVLAMPLYALGALLF